MINLQTLDFISKFGYEALSQYGIIAKYHETLPLVLLNYRQCDSPKTDAIVRECRGLMLNTETMQPVVISFNRFFNWGEVKNEQKGFDFSNFEAEEKSDGSLLRIFYFEGEWRIATRGSFGQGKMPGTSLSWDTYVRTLTRGVPTQLMPTTCPKDLVFTCELCSPFNVVVRRYKQGKLVLLTVRSNKDWKEVSPKERDQLAIQWGFEKPTTYKFRSVDQIIKWLENYSHGDKTFEGFVIRDKNNNRWKIKSKTYLALHRLNDNGNVFLPKNIIPLILAGETEEIITYFPEAKNIIEETRKKLDKILEEFLEIWKEGWVIPQDKKREFAIIALKSPFSSVLFESRKMKGLQETEKDIIDLWKNKTDLIVKVLCKNNENHKQY